MKTKRIAFVRRVASKTVAAKPGKPLPGRPTEVASRSGLTSQVIGKAEIPLRWLAENPDNEAPTEQIRDDRAPKNDTKRLLLGLVSESTASQKGTGPPARQGPQMECALGDTIRLPTCRSFVPPIEPHRHRASDQQNG
jgi:hypothetical protein